MSKVKKGKMTIFKTGGKRDETGFNFNLFSISPIGLKRLGNVHYEGDTRYGLGNWRKGLPFSNVLNHALNHLFLYMQGDKSQDNLAKVAWGAFALMHLEQTHPELNDLKPLWDIDQLKDFVKDHMVLKRKKKRVDSKRYLKRR